MSMQANQIVLLEALNPALPSDYQFKIAGSSPAIDESHPLFIEVTALFAGEAASLPYIAGEKTFWATLAPVPTANLTLVTIACESADYRCDEGLVQLALVRSGRPVAVTGGAASPNPRCPFRKSYPDVLMM